MSRPIQTADFDAYPPQARQFAQAHIEVLNGLPFPLAAAILRQISRYDWLFPVERQELEAQLQMLTGNSEAVAPFARITLSPANTPLSSSRRRISRLPDMRSPVPPSRSGVPADSV